MFSEGFKAPFIVRKRDGAYNYATTDLATIQYRKETWDPDLLLYVVDHRQGDHFKQLFAVAKRWGYGEIAMEHVAFGTVLGHDRRPYKTRDGDVIGLESLLDEAIGEARKVVDSTSAHLPEEDRRRISEIVGLGAIKYADLSQNRLSDYVFDMARMVALQGNTATYLQYAYARIRSIFRKGGFTPEAIRRGPAADRAFEPRRAGPGDPDHPLPRGPGVRRRRPQAEHPGRLPVRPRRGLQHVQRGMPGPQGRVPRASGQPPGTDRPDGPDPGDGPGSPGDPAWSRRCDGPRGPFGHSRSNSCRYLPSPTDSARGLRVARAGKGWPPDASSRGRNENTRPASTETD